jgi:hypothetical protein
MAKLLKPPDAGEAQANQPRSVAIVRETIRKEHGCDSKYCRTVHVVDIVDGRVAWDGFVMVFELIDHRDVGCCYAWRDRKAIAGEPSFVLKIPAFDSPESAVREWLDSAQR